MKSANKLKTEVLTNSFLFKDPLFPEKMKTLWVKPQDRQTPTRWAKKAIDSRLNDKLLSLMTIENNINN